MYLDCSNKDLTGWVLNCETISSLKSKNDIYLHIFSQFFKLMSRAQWGSRYESLPFQSSERAAATLCWYRECWVLGMTVQWVCVFHRGSESHGLFSLFTAAARHAAHWPRNEHSSDLQLWMNQRTVVIVEKMAEWEGSIWTKKLWSALYVFSLCFPLSSHCTAPGK